MASILIFANRYRSQPNPGSSGGENPSDPSLPIVFSTIRVYYPEGLTLTCVKNNSEQINVFTNNTDGSRSYPQLLPGTYLFTLTKGEQRSTATLVIPTTGALANYTVNIGLYNVPVFEYSGEYRVVGPDNNEIDKNTYTKNDWRIKFLTSGVLRFTKFDPSAVYQAFLVGGGGGGGFSYNGGYGSGGMMSGGGGGGGYTNTSDISLALNTDYQITVGAGGAGGVNGQATSAFNLNANGGIASSGLDGGAGGSGGGGWSNGKGGTHGSDGTGATSQNGYGGVNGKGQGSTTREFGQENGYAYSGGGAATIGYSGTLRECAEGGGGGAGHPDGYPNTGGGGAGGFGAEIYGSKNSGAGGSGIVIIRAKPM